MLTEAHLRPYQHMIIDHVIEQPKSAVWAFMGAGKSVSVLTAIDRMELAGLLDKPTLIIAPLRVARSVWPNEIYEWTHLKHLKVMPILGSASQRIAAIQTKADIYTINFENLEWLIGLLWDRWPFGMIVVDESTKLKSLRASIRKNKQGTEFVSGKGGQRALALLKVVYQHKPSRFVELSGTPAPNGLQDLWGQVYFLDYGKRLGNVYTAFRNRWFRQSFDGMSIEPQPFAQEQIQNQVKDICISLKAEDWFDVAKPIIRDIFVDLAPDTRRQYKELEKKLLTEISGQKIEAFNAGARTMKCRQMASGACYTGSALDPGERKWIDVHNLKLDALDEIMEEAAGMPVLLAYDFKFDATRILKRFKHARLLDQKPQTEKDWNDGKIPLLIGHPASFGHGMNLQRGGNILVYYSYDWNFETHAQALERIGPVRQAQAGLNRNVYVYRIIARNTIDEDVLESHASKRSIQDILIDSLRRRLA